MFLLGCIICCNRSAERRECALSTEKACEQGTAVDIWTHLGFESDWRLVKVA